MKPQSLQDPRNAAWETAVSSWVDGEAELRADELDSPYGRKLWDTYHLIGDVMRSRDLAIAPSERFYARLSTALDAEQAPHAPARRLRHRAWHLGLSGLAVAAALGSVFWMARPVLLGSDTALGAAPVVAERAVPADDPALRDYMAAHQAMAGIGPVRQAAYDEPGSP